MAATQKRAISDPKSVSPDLLNRTIERAKQELERMIDLNPQVMLLVTRNGGIVRANKALLDLEVLKPSEYKEALKALTKAVLDRKN